MNNKDYTFIIGGETDQIIKEYKFMLQDGLEPAGKYFKKALEDDSETVKKMTKERFLEILINTKKPQIFAESEILGKEHDWNHIELTILGGVNCSVETTIYDDGQWTMPNVHENAFEATLVYVPGALLRGKIQTPDMRRCLKNSDEFEWLTDNIPTTVNTVGLYSLLEEKLKPVIRYISWNAKVYNRKAIITVPGIGCGQFAGGHSYHVYSTLFRVLQNIIGEWDMHKVIQCLWWSPHSFQASCVIDINNTVFVSAPSGDKNETPQLTHPDEFIANDRRVGAGCHLYSLVAWDHASWPGNDFFTMDRYTDDGVKTAASDVMWKLTDIQGIYDHIDYKYIPVGDYTDWLEVVSKNNIGLKVEGNMWKM